MSAFLDAEDVVRLTGYTRRSKQAEWLRANGVQFWINAQGEPIVPVSAINGSGQRATAEKPWEPDYSSISGKRAR